MSPNEHAADGAQNASTEAATAQNAGADAAAQNAGADAAAQNAGADAAGQGPPSELPDAAPDFVGEIHATITDFLGGGIDSLGEAVRGAAANGMAGDAVSVATDVAMAIPV
ncbi:MAG: hypothetical protein V5A18_00165 [Haloarculaceae archaeon]